MKKLLLCSIALALFLSPTMVAHSESATGKSYSFVVHTRSGEKHTYPVGDNPVLTHDGKSVVITSSDLTMEYAPGTVDRFEMEATGNSTSSIGIADKVQNGAALEQGASTLLVSGARHGDAVYVYSVSGAMVASSKISADGTASLSTEGLAKGVYVVKTGSTNFKIIKK